MQAVFLQCHTVNHRLPRFISRSWNALEKAISGCQFVQSGCQSQKKNAWVNTALRKHRKENVQKTFNLRDNTALMTRLAAQSEVYTMAPRAFNARCPSSTALKETVPPTSCVCCTGMLSQHICSGKFVEPANLWRDPRVQNRGQLPGVAVGVWLLTKAVLMRPEDCQGFSSLCCQTGQ